MESSVAAIPAEELAGVVLQSLEQRGQAMTASQVRESLPRRYRQSVAEITSCLEDLAGKGKIYSWPPHRSKAPRYATQTMDEFARATMKRLLAEQAFTRQELLSAVRRAVGALADDRAGQLLDEILSTGQVRKLPPRLGGSANLLGTPHPRSYLAPVFESLGKSLARLLPRLESEGVSRQQVLAEATTLWTLTLREAEEESQATPADEPIQRSAETSTAPEALAESRPPMEATPQSTAIPQESAQPETNANQGP
jgi:hypothetical protein